MLLKLGQKKYVDVLAADKKPQPLGLASNIEYRTGDLNDIQLSELEDFAPTVFIHLAATFERSAESLDFWVDNFENNILLSHHLMSLMIKLPSLKRVVFASSYLVYDQSQYQFEEPQVAPTSLNELSNVRPRNLIGMSKLAHEKELEFLDLYFSRNFSSLSVRIFRGFGRGSRDVISRWIRSLISNKPVEIYSPEGIFDFIYAKDSAEGILRLALESSSSGVINLGSGTGRRVGDILQILETHFPNIKTVKQDVEIPFEASQADIAKLTKTLNWQPEYNLESAISEIIEHELMNLDEKISYDVTNILVTSSSKKAPLIRALQKAAQKIDMNIKVIAGDLNRNVVTKFVGDDFWEMPPLADHSFDEILAKCLELKIGVIIPTRDGELVFWTKNKEKLKERGITVLVSSLKTVTTCLDKFEFYEYLHKVGFNGISTSFELPPVPSDALYVVKERFGSGSIGVGIGLNYEEATTYASTLEFPIFQPLITGEEISVDIWIIPDYYESVVLRSRDLVVNGESQITSVFRNQNLERTFMEIARNLEIIGPAVFQAIIDKNGEAQIIECNARFGGASTASIAAGSGGFESMIDRYIFGNKSQLPRKRVQEIKGLTQVRTAVDHYYDSNF